MKTQGGLNLKFPRRKTRQIRLGDVLIGGGVAIAVQSMTKTDTRDDKATVAQIRRLQEAGCEIVRVAVPDMEAARALTSIKAEIEIPIIADIHFDHKLALEAIRRGIDGLRINPGNIGSASRVKEVVKAAAGTGTPIRIGVNSGSLEKDLLKKFGGATPEAMVESAMRHVRILEDLNFQEIKISLKASDVARTLEAYSLLADKVDYPFHAGITEAGSLISGSVKSAAGLTLLLSRGLVDTVRVSLTAPPEEEVRIAFLILASLGIRRRGVEIVSCPVCGRCQVEDFPEMAMEIEKGLAAMKAPMTVAVMGCMVNGPGEAKEADLGVACGQGVGVIFRQGRLLRKVPEDRIIAELMKEARSLAENFARD